MAGKKPWEKYAEGAGPWDMYNSVKSEEREMEKGLPSTMSHVGTLAIQGGSHDFADEIMGGVHAATGGDYTEGRDQWREKVADSRDELGLAGDLIEAGASTATSSLLPGGPLTKNLISAGIQGAGAAEEMDDVPKGVATSTAVAGASHVAGKILKKTIEKPMDILARTAGARGIEFRNGEVLLDGELLPDEIAQRAKDPAGVAARLDKIGFFSKGDKMLDPAHGKYIWNPAGDRLESAFKPQSIETLLSRTQQGVDRLKSRNNQLIGGKKIPLDSVNQVLMDALNKFVPKGSGVTSRARAATDLIQEVVDDLQARRHIKLDSRGNAYIDADNIEQVKKFMQDKVASTFNNGKAVSDITNEGVQARRIFSEEFDKLVDRHAGAEYAKNNDLMRDLLLTQKMLHNKASRVRGYGLEGPQLTAPKRQFMDFVNGAMDNPSFGAKRATMGKMVDTKPGQMSTSVLERLPVEMMDNSNEHPMSMGRQPQSVPNIPEHLIRTPLPRTTQELMQNKQFVLAKVAQMAPEMFEGIKDVYDHDPERMSELAPVIAAKMPHLFARDKYNRFDGRIMAEQDKQRAIKDTLSDPKLNSIQQAEIITKLNKDGIYDR